MNRTDYTQQGKLDFQRAGENNKAGGSQKRALIVMGILLLFFAVAALTAILLLSSGRQGFVEPTMKDGKKQKQHLEQKRRDDERRLQEMEDKLVENPDAERTTSARRMIKEFETLYEREKENEQGSNFSKNIEKYDPFDNDLERFKSLNTKERIENTQPDTSQAQESIAETAKEKREKKSMQVIKDEEIPTSEEQKESTKEKQAAPFGYVPGTLVPMTTKNQSVTLCYNKRFPLVTLYEGNFLEGVLLTEISSDVQEGPVIASIERDVYDDSGTYVIIPYGTRVIGKTGAVNYRGQKRLYISFSRMILPQRKPGEKRVSIDLPAQAAGLDSRGINGLASKVDRHFWLQYGSALLLGVLDGVTGLARNRIKGSDFSVMIDEPSHNLDTLNDSRFSSYSSIMPTVTVKAGAKVKIYMNCDIEISAFDLTRNRPYAKSKQRRTP